jgi:hypothetical protein
VNVARVTEADEQLAEAVGRLVPQLSPKRRPAGLTELAELVASPGTSLIVARDGADVLGMLTLVPYRPRV